mgnify:CR=1 FL=1
MSKTLDYSPTEGDNRASCRYVVSLWTTTLGEDTWHISSWLIGKNTRLRRWRQKGTDKRRLPDREEDHPTPSVESWQAIAMQRASGEVWPSRGRQQKSEKLDGAMRSMIRNLLRTEIVSKQISGRLKLELGIEVSHETIDGYIWADKKSGGRIYWVVSMKKGKSLMPIQFHLYWSFKNK